MSGDFVPIDPPLEVIIDPGSAQERGGSVIGLLGSSFCAIDRTGAVGWLIAPELLVVDPRVQVVAESASHRLATGFCVDCGQVWPCDAAEDERHRLEAAA